MPIYDDGRASKPWIIDFAKMKVFDGEGAELGTITRNSANGAWGYGPYGKTSKLPEAVTIELEQAYIRWLNKEITG